MKAVQVLLLLCIIASFECDDIFSKITCLLGNPAVYNTIKELINKIKEKQNVFEIGGFLISKYSEVKEVVVKCF